MCVAASKTAEPRSLQPYASPRSFSGELGTIAASTPHAPAVSLPPTDRQEETSTAYIEVEHSTGDLRGIDPVLGNTVSTYKPYANATLKPLALTPHPFLVRMHEC